jgi:hypothetical protein
LQSQKENETEKGGYEKEPEIDDIHHKMKLHMNTKIMGLHTKLINRSSAFLNFASLALSSLNLTSFELSGWLCSLFADFLGLGTGLYFIFFQATNG